jgi:hypothetical protein
MLCIDVSSAKLSSFESRGLRKPDTTPLERKMDIMTMRSE